MDITNVYNRHCGIGGGQESVEKCGMDITNVYNRHWVRSSFAKTKVLANRLAKIWVLAKC